MRLAFLIPFALLTACHQAGDDPKNFIGVWENKNVPAQQNNTFGIKDRILIESSDGNTFQVSILARGVFTEMRHIPEKGYICAENKACFALKDKNTLLAGSENGTTVSYERSNEK